MARAARIALDLALVSVTKMRPTVCKIWGAAKSVVVKTPARPLVCNVVVSKVESTLDNLAGFIESAITSLRDKQLPREEKYLERELDKVRQKMNSDGRGDAASKSARPWLGHAWQYAKVEMVPPMTMGFFNGAPGKKLEDSVAKSLDGFIAGLDKKIKDMDQAELKAQQDKEAAIKAAQDKAKAVAKAKEDERKKVEEAQRKEAEKKAKAKADATAKENAKKAPPPAAKKDDKAKKVDKPKAAKKEEPKKK